MPVPFLFADAPGAVWERAKLDANFAATATGGANVLTFGADATGVADSSAAFLAAWTANKTIYAPAGTYRVSVDVPTTLFQRTLRGDGRGRTTLVPIGNNDCIRFSSAGLTEHTVELSDFSIQGPGVSVPITFTVAPIATAVSATLTVAWPNKTGEYAVIFSDGNVRYCQFTNGATGVTWAGFPLGAGVTVNATTGGSGIHFPTNAGNNPFEVLLSRLTINGMGASAILERAGAFTWNIDNVDWSANLGHGIDIIGGNTTTLQNCYAHAVPTASQCGYRIHGGGVLISCNALDSGSNGYVFDDTLAEDGTVSFGFPVMLNSHCEDHAGIGVRAKNNGVKFINTDLIAPAAGNVVNYLQDSTLQGGTCDNVQLLLQTKGATFANGSAIHTRTSVPPFAWALSPSSAISSFSYYNETDTVTYTCGVFGIAGIIQSGRAGLSIGDVLLQRLAQTTQHVSTRAVVPYSASMTPNLALGNIFDVTVTNGTAFTVNAPTNGYDGQRFEMCFINASGGALGAATFNAAWHLAGAFPAPANGFNRTLQFTMRAGGVIYETTRFTDVAN